MVTLRRVVREDLHVVVEIENACFIQGEAATEIALKERMITIPDTFIVASIGYKIVGFVNGPVISYEFITDDLFLTVKRNSETGGHQSILGLAVLQEYQNRGIGGALLSYLEKIAQKQESETVTLTCKGKYIPFYENHGYRNEGSSVSQLGGETWYNMIKRFG